MLEQELPLGYGADHLTPRTTRTCRYWLAVEELNVSYHDPETISVTIYPYYGNLS